MPFPLCEETSASYSPLPGRAGKSRCAEASGSYRERSLFPGAQHVLVHGCSRQLASLLLALLMAGPGCLPTHGPAWWVSVAFKVVQIETATISSQFPLSSWKESRSLKWSGSSAPSTFPSQENLSRQLLPPHTSQCLTAALPAQLHQHKGRRIC